VRAGNEVSVTVWGEGDPAVLIHGSFGWGSETWEKQRPLGDSYRLLLVDRRGFGTSAANGPVDFERDASDISDLLDEPAHLVGQSYGGVVALLTAARSSERVRSLTVIEPPAFGLVRGDPAVEQFIAGVEEAVRAATDPSDYRLRFLRSFGFSAEREELSGRNLDAATSSWRERPPWEAEIPLDLLAAAPFPKLVVRGDWSTVSRRARDLGGRALHAVCDMLERRLDAEAAVFPAAHNPQLLGEPFNERLCSFWKTT
jgi:pimeloyl-ACP methyl ester carboxylesterase